MDNKMYQERAILTESVPQELNFGEVGLHMMINASLLMATLMDEAKKTMFYGKKLDTEKFRDTADNLAGYANMMYQYSDQLSVKNDKALYQKLPDSTEDIDPKNLDLRKLHCAIGIFTESAELLSAMKKQLEGKPLDEVNYAEEIGDVLWYTAIGADASKTTLGNIQTTNIAKLAARYPEKFTPEAALQRNLDKERQILEGNVA